MWALKEETNIFLISMGLKLTPFSTESKAGRILVGNPEDIDNEAKWNHLMELASQGADVLFLNSDLFSGNDERCARLPIPGGMKVTFIRDWLYHKECIATHSPVFDGLNGAGLWTTTTTTRYTRTISSKAKRCRTTSSARASTPARTCTTAPTARSTTLRRTTAAQDG